MNEEVIIRMGMDTAGVESGLRGAEHRIKEFGEKAGETFSELSKEFIGPLTLAGGVAILERTLSKVQQINRAAESLGVSTDFIQEIQNVGNSAGIAAEQVEKMMGKFANKLAPGSNIEEAFFQFADAVAATEDPVKRVQMAVDAFGEKLGPKFVSTLARGRDGIKELAAGFSEFSKADIKSLEESKLAMERFENFTVIWAGRILMGLQFVGKNVYGALTGDFSGAVNMVKRGAAANAEGGESKGGWVSDMAALAKYKEHLDDLALRSKTMNFDEKIGILEKRKAYQEHATERAKGDDELYQLATKISDTEAEILNLKKEQNDEIQKALDEGEKQLDQDKKHAEHLQRAAKDAKEDVAARAHQNSGVTLQDLANAPWQMFNNGIQGWRGPTAQSQAAQRILQLRAWAHQNAIAGNIPLAEAQSGEAERINTALEKFNPFLGDSSRKVERHTEETALALKQFLAGHPMVVQGAEGP